MEGKGTGCDDSGIAKPCKTQSDGQMIVQGFQGDIARTLQARHDSSPCADRGMDVVAVQDVAATLRSGSTSPSAHGKLNGTDRMDLVVHTLAIRGRGDHRELETRDDGTANALLLPNGGRDGIGCGAIAFNARQDPDSWEGRTGPLDTDGGTQAVGIPALAACVTSGEGSRFDGESTTMIPGPMQVRRLTPDECALLQGFPDHHAQIPWRKHPAEDCPDGPQYKAYGNSMAVPVMHWIGKRLAQHLKAAQ